MGNELMLNETNCGLISFTDFDKAKGVAQVLAQTQLVPKDCQGRWENIVVKCQYGYELGVKPMAAMKGIVVINGTPAIWGDLMLAICQVHPDFIDCVEELDEKTMTATCTIKRKGRADIKRRFSKDDAITAGLWEKAGPWKNGPKRMLQMRARAFALRDSFADALCGLHSVEEINDGGEMNVSARVVSDEPAASALLAGGSATAPTAAAQQAPASETPLDEQLAEIVGAFEQKANYVLRECQKFITDGQTWREMSDEHKRYCIDRADSFRIAIEKAHIPEAANHE